MHKLRPWCLDWPLRANSLGTIVVCFSSGFTTTLSPLCDSCPGIWTDAQSSGWTTHLGNQTIALLHTRSLLSKRPYCARPQRPRADPRDADSITTCHFYCQAQPPGSENQADPAPLLSHNSHGQTRHLYAEHPMPSASGRSLMPSKFLPPVSSTAATRQKAPWRPSPPSPSRPRSSGR